MENLSIPNSAIKYIMYQRTAYVNIETHRMARLTRRLFPFMSYDMMASIVAMMRKKTVKSNFSRDMNGEYVTIRDFLPNECSFILDVGCGIAGIDALISRHYKSKDITFYLLDKSEVAGRIFYGFNQRGAFYNSLPLAKETLTRNGVSEKCIHLLEATDRNEIEIDRPIDLAISLISWGFHYPVATYLDKVYDLLSENGTLIIDVRKGTDGMVQLQNKFGNCRVILDAQKHDRVLCQKHAS